MMIGRYSLFELRINLAKKSTSLRSFPFDSALNDIAVLRFFIRSESSLRSSRASSTAMINLFVQSELNCERKSSLVLKVILLAKIAFRKFRKVVFPVLRSLDTSRRIGSLTKGFL